MRTTIATLALLLLAPLPAGAAPATERAVPEGAPDGLAVTGYALPSTPPEVIGRDAGALTTVTVAAVSLRPDGASVTRPDDRVAALVESTHAVGLRAELLVGNYSDRLGGFDPDALSALLSSDAHIGAVADRLAALVRAGGWDGVNVDLELVRRRDSRGLVAFVTALRERLSDTASVTIDVSASSTSSAYLSRGYRMAELAAVVDAIQLMAYDQHGPGWSGPGPVGGLPWVEKSVAAALELVPADKLDLGIAGYGYLWNPDGTGRTLTVKAARNLVGRAGGTARWRAGAGEWSARLSGGRRVWWSDGRSYDARASLAAGLGLRGTAIWRLGSAGPLD
ncbi:Spore germination protein YaaH [Nocardioides exalbidus]|uniref:Spore germination protein YaaH n=1 Tax=Nocardioides exalbidus TaxID=402596 RepID=A0A1H4LSL4_9ACTN|nr:glycosyl hydrolase family 18 protein [Nocardioides exalbidus]SEB73646.1 Spore germination protein YaaH [Nocardioides exalbidus]